MYLIIFLICFIGLFISNCIYNHSFHPLRHVPGPLVGRFTNAYRLYLMMVEHFPSFNLKLHKLYGPVMRVTPSLVSISDPDMIPTVYYRTADKTDFYSHGVFGERPSTVQILDHREHATKRRVIAPLLAMKNIRLQEDKLDERILELQRALVSNAKATANGLEFTQWIRWFLLDVITHLVFGEPAGFMKEGDVGGLLHGLRDMTLLSLLLGVFPWLINPILKVPYLRRRLIPRLGDKWGTGRMMAFCHDHLQRRRCSSKAYSATFLDLLLEIQSVNEETLDDEDLITECMMLMVAALNSTAGLICPLINNMVQNPGMYRKLNNEITSFEQASRLSPIATLEETSAMPYFMACLQETIRLNPSIPMLLPRRAPEEGLDLNGIHISGGTEIAANPFVINRDETVFGEDSQIFSPDRWLTEDTERIRKMEKSIFTFGYGARECLGSRLARVEAQKVALHLFRCFVFTRGRESEPWALHKDRGFAIYEQQWLKLQIRDSLLEERNAVYA